MYDVHFVCCKLQAKKNVSGVDVETSDAAKGFKTLESTQTIYPWKISKRLFIQLDTYEYKQSTMTMSVVVVTLAILVSMTLSGISAASNAEEVVFLRGLQDTNALC